MSANRRDWPSKAAKPCLLICFLIFGCIASQRDYSEKEADGGVFGSVAVAVIRSDTIAIAAESRTTTDGVLNPDTACKMTIVDSVVFAATGLLKGNSAAVPIIDFARVILEQPGRVPVKIQRFQEGASSLLSAWLNKTIFRDSLEASPVYRYQHSIHAFFCFFSRNRPVVVKFAFTPSMSANGFGVNGVYDAGARKPGEIIWIGAMEQTDSLLKKGGIFAERVHGLSAVEAAEILVKKQMEYTPRIVGGPVDIALITTKGAEWIRRKQSCY
jgi:hypothetical protein